MMILEQPEAGEALICAPSHGQVGGEKNEADVECLLLL